MAFTAAQKREARAIKRRTQEPRFYPNRLEARMDTLSHFRVGLARRVYVEGRCDACPNLGQITDGYMLICEECGKLLKLEV